MSRARLLSVLAVSAVAALALAGCASATAAAPTASPSDDRVAVVASTNVYGQLAQEIGGDAVSVTSIVASASADPHEYEATPSDQLAVRDAALIIDNGGGYDSFVDGLITASGSTAPVIVAAELSHDWPGASASPEPTEAHDHDHDHEGHAHVEGFNEHVWYDPHTVEHVVEAIRDRLSALRPADAAGFAERAENVITGIGGIEAKLADIKAAHAGAGVIVTEPVPGYLVAAAGLTDATPPDFPEAVEAGKDVPPAVLHETLGLVDGGTVKVVLANAQTGGAETTRVIDAAKAQGIPVLEFTETLPDGQTYVQWMTQNVEQLATALGK